MLYGVFYWVVNISIAATVAGLFVALLRKIKQIPKRLPYALWGVVFIRFITPFMVSSSFSIMNFLTKLGTKTIVVSEVTQLNNRGVSGTEITTMNSLQFADHYFPIHYTLYRTETMNTLIDIFEKAAVIWAIITIAALLTVGFLYFFTTRELRKAVHYKDNIFICESIANPSVFGIFRQKILLPRELDEKTLSLVLSHEHVHIRRKDNLRRMIALIIACLHWFNPFIWLFLKGYFDDMELACDQKAIKSFNNEKRREYARTLLEFVPTKQTVISSTFSGSKVKLRIENILAYKTLSALSALAFSAFAVMVAYTLLTSAK